MAIVGTSNGNNRQNIPAMTGHFKYCNECYTVIPRLLKPPGQLSIFRTTSTIQDVVRSITEPQDAATVLRNIDKYFTEDAFLVYPVAIQPQFARGRDNLKALYYIFRKGTHDNKIHFHAVMFSEDLTQCTLELTEDVKTGFLIPGPLDYVRFLVRVDLRLDPDGKYRIWRWVDNTFSSNHPST
ncbi:uncharacterized protein VP01_1262g2 [Puccinia sorghi]|uniref:SigF-like NTF2-like domain-containing protein n=1 Tax=Puccinia sorghi TaxID=27349 RepID=A0A0L6VQN5_9BASI|nr:uncharacterized protein VP01_1262g2 [Puccinia sorghi]